jgi:hypothetical protein
MTADAFRVRVQKAITASLEQNVAGPDFNYTLAGAVFRGRTLFGPSDGHTLVSILEPPVTPESIRTPAEVVKTPFNWSLLIQGFVPDDPANPSDPAHMLMADVRKRFAIEKKRFLTGAAVESDRTRNVFGLGRFRDGVDGPEYKNYIDEISFIGTGIVRPPDDGISDKAYFWLPLTLKLVEDIENPFV